MVRRKPQRQQVRLLTTALRMEVRAFASVGGGGRRRQNLERKREAQADRRSDRNILEELGKIRSAKPGSPIQEQIRAWIQICGRKVAYLKRSQKNETSRPTFASSNLRKPPKGGFFLIAVQVVINDPSVLLNCNRLCRVSRIIRRIPRQSKFTRFPESPQSMVPP